MTEIPIFRQVGIIGTGRAAQALALGLVAHSAAPPVMWGRSPSHCAAAAQRVGPCRASSSLTTLMDTCDVIAIAVADDAMPGIVETMAAVGTLAHAPLIFHVSGSMGSAALGPLRANGARTAAIHPAMTFTGFPEIEVHRMNGACFAVTAEESALAVARQIVDALGGVPVEIAEHNRPLYHAALCHAANHLVTLLAGSLRMLECAGVEDGTRVIACLASAALDNTMARGFEALSGPVLRGDADTIRKHLTALEGACPETLPAYRAMVLATLAELGGTDTKPARSALRRLLDE